MRLFLLMILFNSAFATEINYLTDKAKVNERLDLFNNNDLPGIRVGILGIKKANASHGPGNVNQTIDAYEKQLLDQLDDQNVKVYKTDFKGYYITCEPMPSCADAVNEKLSKLEIPALGDDANLGITHISSNSYKEGYVKARVKSHFPNQDLPFERFIEKEFTQALLDTTKSKSLEEVNIQDPDFKAQLDEQIEEFRKNGPDKLKPDFKRLVLMLDLLEIPYAASTDIDNELEKALLTKAPKTGLHVYSAQTGDDLFLIIKKGNKTLRTVGADARGLGKLNMVTRLEEFSNHLKSGAEIKKMDTIFELSTKAIKDADELMDKSMGLYEELLKKELKFVHPRDLDVALKNTHLKYNLKLKQDPELMRIRAGSLAANSKDHTRLMNRIGAIHNRLKTLEKHGINETFGSSCINLELQLLKKGLK